MMHCKLILRMDGDVLQSLVMEPYTDQVEEERTGLIMDLLIVEEEEGTQHQWIMEIITHMDG